MKKHDVLLPPDELYVRARRTLLDVRYDAVMKELFFAWTKESRTLLRYLLETFLDQKVITSIKRLNPAIFNQKETGQHMFVDGACQINDKDIVVVEMQKNRHQTDFDRFNRYGCAIVQYRSDCCELYREALNLVMIFLGYPLPKNLRGSASPYFYCRNDRGVDVSKLHMLMVVELENIEDLWCIPPSQLSSKDRYRLWLRYGHEEEYFERMKEVIKYEEGLKMAEQMLMNISKSNKFSEIFQRTTEEIFRNEKAYHDTLLQIEQERARVAQEQAKNAQEKASNARQQALLAQQAMESERKEKEKEHQLRLQIQKEYLTYKISTLLQSGLNEEEICIECHLTKQELIDILIGIE